VHRRDDGNKAAFQHVLPDNLIDKPPYSNRNGCRKIISDISLHSGFAAVPHFSLQQLEIWGFASAFDVERILAAGDNSIFTSRVGSTWSKATS
jgi:hypothetical protein